MTERARKRSTVRSGIATCIGCLEPSRREVSLPSSRASSHWPVLEASALRAVSQRFVPTIAWPAVPGPTSQEGLHQLLDTSRWDAVPNKQLQSLATKLADQRLTPNRPTMMECFSLMAAPAIDSDEHRQRAKCARTLWCTAVCPTQRQGMIQHTLPAPGLCVILSLGLRSLGAWIPDT